MKIETEIMTSIEASQIGRATIKTIGYVAYKCYEMYAHQGKKVQLLVF
jgi:hypothetical protein